MLRSGQHTFCFLSDESRHSCSNKDAKLYNTKPFDCFTIRVFLHFFLGGGHLLCHVPINRSSVSVCLLSTVRCSFPSPTVVSVILTVLIDQFVDRDSIHCAASRKFITQSFDRFSERAVCVVSRSLLLRLPLGDHALTASRLSVCLSVRPSITHKRKVAGSPSGQLLL